jgi:polysaccharide export outer membrane protein
MSKLHALAIIPLLFIGLTGLFAQQQKGPANQQTSVGPGGKSPQARAEVNVDPDSYVIGAEDVLDISVWQEKDVSRSVPVRSDGKISIPLVDDIQAAGLTPMQLAASITEKLKKFLTKPQVTVTVTAINSKRVFVVGEVAKPGPLPLLPNMTVLQALSMAGGPTQFADEKHAYVSRHERGANVLYPLNYRALLRGDVRKNMILKAGDTIVVP